jgi:hypothetical protein
MMRLAKVGFAVLAVMSSVSLATAHEFVCPEGPCFPGETYPGYPVLKAHKFHPRWRDGLPLVNDFQDYPDGHHGVGCVSSWRHVTTPKGPTWAVIPFCLDY